MQAFLKLFDDKYGGVEEYIKRFVGLSEDDITIIKKNILVPSTSRL